MEKWRQAVLAWYPDLHIRTHFVPPVYMYRIPYASKQCVGQTVLVPGILATSGQSQKSLPGTTSRSDENKQKGNKVKKPKQTHSQNVTSSPSSTRLTTTSSTSLSYSDTSTSNVRSHRQIRLHDQKSKESQGQNTEQGLYHAAAPHSSEIDKPGTIWNSLVNTNLCRIPVYESNTRDDHAVQHVLHCLRKFGETRSDGMFVLSQLRFEDYLSDPAYSDAAGKFPRPSDLQESLRRGDFDLLIIHRHLGILIGEIKAVGQLNVQLQRPTVDTDAVLVKRLAKAAQQLEKSEKVVKHLLQDISEEVALRKSLVLPYVCSKELERVLSADPVVGKSVCRCLEASTIAQAVRQCLCSDQLSSAKTPWDVRTEAVEQMSRWWDHLWQIPSSSMTSSVYLDLVARFAGPATTVSLHCPVGKQTEVRTTGQAVAETGKRFTNLVLIPTQLGLIYEAAHNICLTGPPGSGKSVVLTLVGLKWLWQGLGVQVVSTWLGSLASSTVMHRQLAMTPRPSGEMTRDVHLHNFDLYNHDDHVEAAVDRLSRAASDDGTLCVLMDETLLVNRKLAPRYARLFKLLFEKVPNLFIWIASVGRENVPAELSQRVLSAPLRCPPTVTREVERGLSFHADRIHPYEMVKNVSPCDGPGTMHIHHEGSGHEGKWPTACFQCGLDVAGVLKTLGVEDRNQATTLDKPALHYSDVFILTRDLDLCDVVRDSEGHVISPASAFVEGLRSKSGTPVAVLAWRVGHTDEDLETYQRFLKEVATAAQDQVVVADYSCVRGLERKVVVSLPGRWSGVDDKRSAEEVRANERLHAFSRCTAQLVLLHVPD